VGTDVGIASQAADRLLALILVTAKQEVGDPLLGDDVCHIVGVDHHRGELEIQLLGQGQRIELLHEQRHILIAEGLADLHDQLAAAAQGRRAIGVRLLAGLQPGLARVAAPPARRCPCSARRRSLQCARW